MTDTRFDPDGPLRGSIRPPGDKSISHRAAIVAAMVDGTTEIRDFLDAVDTRSTLEAVSAVGARVESAGGTPGSLRISGPGIRGAAPAEIDVGNAGTLLRILPGWLAGQGWGEWTLDGDESIRARPVDRVAEPLRLMGAHIGCRAGRLPPLRVQGADLRGIEYELPVASAQVKSCLLLAGLLAKGETTVVEPLASRDHTERMLRAAGVDLEVQDRRIVVRPPKRLGLDSIDVPGDFSSAAFFLLAALLVPGCEVRIEGVGLNPTRTGLLTILERMGADIKAEVEDGGDTVEPAGALEIRHAELAGTEVQPAEVPLAIDELPLVALAGCFASGETVVRGAAELRHKESDRIGSLLEGLQGLGADAEALEDGFVVRGSAGLEGGIIDSHGDHRLAMLGAIAGLASRDGVTVRGADAAAISYPGFESDLASLVGR